jgi:hypothetical protein
VSRRSTAQSARSTKPQTRSGRATSSSTPPLDLRQKSHAPGRRDPQRRPRRGTIFVNRTKDEIKDAPEFDPDSYDDDAYRTSLGGYYGLGGPGYRDY